MVSLERVGHAGTVPAATRVRWVSPSAQEPIAVMWGAQKAWGVVQAG